MYFCFLDICWLRLDFETFTNQGPALTEEASAAAPEVASACTDTFTVTSSTSSINYPVICGENTGQHSKRIVQRNCPWKRTINQKGGLLLAFIIKGGLSLEFILFVCSRVV